jgi:hypothetical protein
MATSDDILRAITSKRCGHLTTRSRVDSATTTTTSGNHNQTPIAPKKRNSYILNIDKYIASSFLWMIVAFPGIVKFGSNAVVVHV